METEDFGEKWVRELDQEFSFRYADFEVFVVCPRGMSSKQLSMLFFSSGERHKGGNKSIKVVMKTRRKNTKPREKVVDTSLGEYQYLKED